MRDGEWMTRFREAYATARAAYERGAKNPEECIRAEDRGFLTEIGCSPQELFDFVEDDVTMGAPGLEKALRITGVRRQYYLQVDKGHAGGGIARGEAIPSREATLGGIRWLPRIIAKARAKLRGELPPELMYCCGGDRQFLGEHRLEPDEFLEAVWKAGGQDQEILAYVRGARTTV